MIESPARVTRIEGATAWVISEAPSSCGACGGKGCGSSAFNRLWHPENPEFHVANPIHAQPGEAVVVGLPEGALLQASTAAYLVPLASLLAGAAFGQLVVGGELAAALGGLTGLLLAGLWLKGRRPRNEIDPVILRRGTTACANGH
ncbi:MAG: SoxR reducing system RseC family protein [Thiobacillus sp.]|nr:SoxR reducing system RseC family protein [Thiobacillus sp.]